MSPGPVVGLGDSIGGGGASQWATAGSILVVVGDFLKVIVPSHQPV